MKKIIYTFLAFTSLLLGIIGMVLPVMPTVPFLLAALYFAGADPRIKNFIMRNRLLREYYRFCQGNTSLPGWKKYSALAVLWLSLGVSAYMIQQLWCYITLSIIGIAVSWHLLHLPDRKL